MLEVRARPRPLGCLIYVWGRFVILDTFHCIRPGARATSSRSQGDWPTSNSDLECGVGNRERFLNKYNLSFLR